MENLDQSREGERKKVPDYCVESRVRTDTFVGGHYHLALEENAGAAAPPEKYLEAYRKLPRRERQTEIQYRFWKEFEEVLNGRPYS